MVDTPVHMLVECFVANQTWSYLIDMIPKSPHIPLIEYVLGIHDGKIEMSIKSEILKMLMHNREMDAVTIHRRLKNYFLTVHSKNNRIREIFE
jgi:hypothetical protein